jgi:invasion protein IalB
MIDQARINRRDVLFMASSMLGASAIAATPAAAQTQTPAGPKSETDNPSSIDTPNEPYASPSRGRRAS